MMNDYDELGLCHHCGGNPPYDSVLRKCRECGATFISYKEPKPTKEDLDNAWAQITRAFDDAWRKK